MRLYEMMKSNKTIVLDRLFYGVVLTTFMHLSTFESALAVFNDCNKQFNLGKTTNPKYISEEAVLFCNMIATSDKCGVWSASIAFFEKMHLLHSQRPSIGSINCFVRACMKLNQWHKLDQVAHLLDLGNLDLPGCVSSSHHEDPKEPCSCVEKVECTEDGIGTEWRSLRDCIRGISFATQSSDIGAAIAKVSEYSAGSQSEADALKQQLVHVSSNSRLVDNAKLRRRIKRLQEKLTRWEGATPSAFVTDSPLNSIPISSSSTIPVHSKGEDGRLQPDIQLFKTLIECAGILGNASLAFDYFHLALERSQTLLMDNNSSSRTSSTGRITHNCTPFSSPMLLDRGIYRALVEACLQANDTDRTEKARTLLMDTFGTLKSARFKEFPSGRYVLAAPQTAMATCRVRNLSVNVANGIGIYSSAVKKMIKTVKGSTAYRIDHEALPEKGRHIPVLQGKEILSHHCEKQALALQVEASPEDRDCLWHVDVSLCMCTDCHSFFASASECFEHSITCRDPSTLHLFSNGICSCGGHWGGR